MLSHHVMFGGFLVLTVMAWFILLLASSVAFAEMKNKELVGQIAELRKRSEARNIETFGQQLRLAQGNIEQLDRIQKNDRLRFTHLLRDLIGLIPPEIALKDMAIDRAQHKITLSGTAPSRSTLITFKSRLENDPDYTSVSLPLEQLLRETNLAFSLSFTFRETSN